MNPTPQLATKAGFVNHAGVSEADVQRGLAGSGEWQRCSRGWLVVRNAEGPLHFAPGHCI